MRRLTYRDRFRKKFSLKFIFQFCEILCNQVSNEKPYLWVLKALLKIFNHDGIVSSYQN